MTAHGCRQQGSAARLPCYLMLLMPAGATYMSERRSPIEALHGVQHHHLQMHQQHQQHQQNQQRRRRQQQQQEEEIPQQPTRAQLGPVPWSWQQTARLGADGLHIQPTLAVNTHYWAEQPGETAMLSRAFRMVRTDAGVSWLGTEPAPGLYNFSTFGTLLATLQTHGLGLHVTLAYTNRNYDGNLSPQSPQAQEAYARWVLAAVKFAREQLGGGPTGILWECYNEPNMNATKQCSAHPPAQPLLGRLSAEERTDGWYPCVNASAYAALAVTVGKHLKAVYPDEIYIGPAASQVWGCTGCFDWTGLDTPFLTTCFEAGALQ